MKKTSRVSFTVVEVEEEAAHVFVVDFPSAIGFILRDDLQNNITFHLTFVYCITLGWMINLDRFNLFYFFPFSCFSMNTFERRMLLRCNNLKLSSGASRRQMSRILR